MIYNCLCRYWHQQVSCTNTNSQNKINDHPAIFHGNAGFGLMNGGTYYLDGQSFASVFILIKFVKNKMMPKIYEYLGILIFFYSNEDEPIHVHGKYDRLFCFS